MAIELRVLGNVEVCLDGRQVDIGHAKRRCVLAALLIDAGHVVTVDQLMDRVWAEHPPHRARAVLRAYLSKLRQALLGTGLTIERRNSGYLLDVDPDAVDAHRFRRLVAEAHAETDERDALAVLEAALALWRGEALAGLDTPWINAARHALEQERFAAEADRIDLALGQGHHTALLAELATRAHRHPLDERLAEQLMLALYRCGRPAEALEHYQQMRLRLSEELGIDPSPPLQQLHQRILTGDPTLTHVKLEPVSGHGPVPRQLPPSPRLFTGRTRELAALDKAVNVDTEAVVISAIGGVGGVGKTWLALHWAHRNAEQFPDGQLYVNLRGFDPAGAPTAAAVALRGLLDALGMDPAAIPVDLDAQVGLYRSLIAGKRMLLVLDNARDTDQVLPLLPGTPPCAVVVTCRHQLGALVAAHGAFPLQLDVLDPSEARELLAAHLGAARIAAEPEAAAELLDHCAGLPLAISIVAARSVLHPARPLRALANELHDATTRLDALDAGELSVNLRAVFSWSSRALDDDTSSLFGLLGLAPGPDITLTATASLTALPTSRARALLHNLEKAHMVQQHQPGRYRMHDLVRLYAADQARHPTEEQGAALRRLVDHYTHTAVAGERLLDPHRASLAIDVALDSPAPGSHPHPLRDQTAALQWFQGEHPNLLAAQQAAVNRAWPSVVWELAWSLSTFHRRRGHRQEEVAVWRAGVTAADQLADPATQSLARRLLGTACARLGWHDEALRHLRQALTLAERTNDVLGQAHTHYAIAGAWSRREEDRRAWEHAHHALRLFQALDQPVWEADALNALGWYAARLGEYDQARMHCQAALDLCRRHHFREVEAGTLDSLGFLADHTGRHAEAVRYYQHALTLFRDLGSTYYEADTLDHLGHAYAAADQRGQAREVWQQVLELYKTQHRVEHANRVQQHLDALEKHPTSEH